MINRQDYWGLGLALVCVLSFSEVDANNGSFVVAFPVQDIKVDGDFSDWPVAAQQHSIRHNVYGSPNRGPLDCEASFQAGYDRTRNLLYLAVEVKDDSLVTAAPVQTWKTRDGNGIRIGVNHGNAGVVGVDFVVKEQGTSRGNRVIGAVQRKNGVHRYEWKLNLELLGQTGDLSQPFTCAFALDVTDDDADGTFHSQFWSPLPFKMIHPDRMGDILLGVDPTVCGKIEGAVTPDRMAKQMGNVLLRIQSKDNPNLLVDVLTDETGNYSVSLPEGDYVRTLRVGGGGSITSSLAVKTGAVTTDQIEIGSDSIVQATKLKPNQTQTIGTGFSTHRPFDVSQLVESKLSFTTYNSSDGLPEVDISSIVEDEQRNLWIGYFGGLVRFDGYKLDVFSNLNGDDSLHVYALLSDHRSGGFWIGSNKGLFHFNTADDVLTNYRLLSGKMVTSLGHAPGHLVCAGTTHGLFVFDGHEFQVFAERAGIASPVQSIELDYTGKFTWVGTENGLLRFDGNGFLPIIRKDASEASASRYRYSWFDGLENDRVFALYSSESGLWIGASDAIYCHDGQEFHRVFTSQAEKYRFARSFHVDQLGSLWTATHDGILRIPTNAKSIDQIRDQIQLSRSPIANSVYSDSTGTVWSGHFNGTLRKYDNNLDYVYTGDCDSVAIDPDGSVNFIETTEHDGATNSWLCRYRDGTIRRWKIPGEGTTLMADSHDVYVGTSRSGLFRFDGEAFSKVGLFEDERFARVFDIEQGIDGELWVGTEIGLFRRNPDGTIDRFTARQGLPSDRVQFIDRFQDGRMVIGTLNGLAILQASGTIKRLPRADELGSKFVTALHIDRDDKLWIGTLDGLHVFSGRELAHLTTDDGLIRNHVDHFIGEDQDGQMWIGSSVGISRFEYQGDVVQKLVAADGLDRGEIRDIAFDQRHVWLVGSQGLIRYTKSPIAPHVVLDKVVTDQVLEPTRSIKLTTDQQHLRLDFHAASQTTRADAILFGYRLRGQNDEWSITANRFVEFSGLPSGKYTFEVCAFDRDLNRSESLNVDIGVSLPFGRYAVLGTMFLALGTSLVLIGSRARKIRKINKELEIRVEKRTAEREELQTQLQHAQKMESLGTLAAGIAHDFNNALCAIQVNVELASLNNGQDDSQSDLHLRHVLKACDQAAGLANSLLTFGGKGKLDIKPNELGRLIRSCLDMIRRTLPATIEIEVDLPQEEHWSSVDSRQIEQVLVNLCVNARDAMPHGGKLTVELFSRGQNATDSPHDVPIHVNVMRISDTGPGIPAELQSRVFEPFYTSKPRGKGTGLGLSIAHGIVSEHGGQMLLESAPNSGCIFDIELPVCGPQELIDEKSSPNFANTLSVSTKQLVVVADDDDILRSALVVALETAGLEVIAAKDGRELMRKVKRNIDRLGMVVLDIDMPRSNGIQCLHAVRELRPDIEAIVITGLSTHQAAFVRDENTRFLKKPFSIQRFIEAVESAAQPVSNAT